MTLETFTIIYRGSVHLGGCNLVQAFCMARMMKLCRQGPVELQRVVIEHYGTSQQSVTRYRSKSIQKRLAAIRPPASSRSIKSVPVSVLLRLKDANDWAAA